MPLRAISLVLPCRRLEDFPTHVTGQAAAELLAAWTVAWHPSFIHAANALPRWHSADEPPDPETLEGELVIVPPAGRQRIAGDWLDRLRATAPKNPPPVEAVASRQETQFAALAAAGLDPNQVAPDHVADFLALGHAYLQVELLTHAMRYTPVLDTHQFTDAVTAAADAAVARDDSRMREELARAFDLLTDARNHVYSVDYYIIDVTLLAPTTLDEPLREKLAAGSPTNLLASGELIEQLGKDHPNSLAELKRAIAADTACVIGGRYAAPRRAAQSPEALLRELTRAQQPIRQHLDRDFQVFAQFHADFSPTMPDMLKGLGYAGALHVAFDGGQLPRADQCKSNWGSGKSAPIDTLATRPLDAAQPETWLKLAEHVGDSIARDHVATVLLASWPGNECEFFDDLRRAARYGPVLGKLLTLEEYFRITRQPDDWTTFSPQEYPNRTGTSWGANALSSSVDAYRREVLDVLQKLASGLTTIAGLRTSDSDDRVTCAIAINPWNASGTRFINADPIAPGATGYASADSGATGSASASSEQRVTGTSSPSRRSLARQPYTLDVPGCGYSVLSPKNPASQTKIVDGLALRNERLELTVSQTTGGIQSLKTHRERSTRVSQRLVFYERTGPEWRRAQSDTDPPPLDTQMIADRVEVTHNDEFVGEITSHGRLLNTSDELLAHFTQRVRTARHLPAMLVDVELAPERAPAGDIWKSYYASRLAWKDDTLSMRCGREWRAHSTARQCIESPEWVELSDGVETITCFALGLPFHRRAADTWLDTLLLVAGEEQRRFQFALALDQSFPTKAALALLSCGVPAIANLPTPPSAPQGWFLHVAAKNVLITHIEPLVQSAGGVAEANLSAAIGVRLRLLETEGRETQTSLAAFRPFANARITDFRGNEAAVLSVADGRAPFDIGPHCWIQLEAEW